MTNRARCEKTRQLLARGARLVDVRSTEEFAGGALKQAVNLPLQMLHQASRLFREDEPLVVYCASGIRSAEAKQRLERSGFREVHDLGSFQNLQQC